MVLLLFFFSFIYCTKLKKLDGNRPNYTPPPNYTQGISGANFKLLHDIVSYRCAANLLFQ